MKIETKIKHYKERLIRKAKRVGMWENFGQNEVRVLEDTYRDNQYSNDGIWDKIRDFSSWCMNFDLSKL